MRGAKFKIQEFIILCTVKQAVLLHYTLHLTYILCNINYYYYMESAWIGSLSDKMDMSLSLNCSQSQHYSPCSGLISQNKFNKAKMQTQCIMTGRRGRGYQNMSHPANSHTAVFMAFVTQLYLAMVCKLGE